LGSHVEVVNVTIFFNPLNADLNPIRQLLALLGVHHILHVSRIRDNSKYRDLYTYVHY
jgi:ribosomal protein L30/L7E